MSMTTFQYDFKYIFVHFVNSIRLLVPLSFFISSDISLLNNIVLK